MEQRKLPPLKSLLFLESVVRTGSVTAAADKMCVTHSAVSKQLSQLEDWLGMQLFVEKRKGMIPTSSVGYLVETVGEAFDSIQEAIHRLEPQADIKHPNLHIIAPATFAMRWLIPKLPAFHIPKRSIDTMVRPTHTSDNWLEIPFDIAIRRGGNIPLPFSPLTLFKEKLALVVSSRLARKVRKIRKEDVAEIGLLDATTRPGELTSWLKAAGMPGYIARQAIELPHFYIALDAMFAGRGALVAPTFLIKDHLLCGEVVEPFPECRIKGATYHIFLNPDSTEKETSTSFIDWIKSSVSKEKTFQQHVDRKSLRLFDLQ